ncbi:uncharacterized protein EDB91DRAFT_1086647 [Suillus paluster]|uniref:uncharacterized protein n=1 Tax=Suillus paluster TaxID=48578 RepID=UPI001B8732A2|nr:uncharacterized protein EDB91DRAFT_1086647 [Suillus paluster]KAG1726790.1 hypothetical protein EDB91DRAFT_1086647 [Suillus paluster]
MLHHPVPPKVARKIITSPTASGDSGESNGDVEIGGTDLDPGTQGGDTKAEDDAEHAYASTEAMGDADCKGQTCHPKVEQTVDVHTIFIKKDDYIDLHTGLVESEHVCTVCQKNGVAARHCFFKGKCRHPNHIKVYQENCKKLDIPFNERVCPKSDGSGTLDSQQSLDSIVVHQPQAPIFTTSGLLDYVVELIVCEDKVGNV